MGDHLRSRMNNFLDILYIFTKSFSYNSRRTVGIPSSRLTSSAMSRDDSASLKDESIDGEDSGN